MTQPTMYSLIEKKGSVRKLYTESLVGRKCITDEEAAEALKDDQSKLESAFAETKEAETGPYDGEAFNAPYEPSDIEAFNCRDGHHPETLRIGEAFWGSRRLHSLRSASSARERRWRSQANRLGLRRAACLRLMLMDGVPVRLAKDPSGTFVQRHSVLVDAVNGNEWTPLANLTEEQARFWVYDSCSSEYAAVG